MSLTRAIAIAAAGEEVRASILAEAFGEIMDGKGTPAQIAALLVALRAKGETAAEIAAAARALRARACLAEARDPRTIDTCGTGGSGRDTFNISTTVCFVVAGAGIPVAKHGNRAASSRSGSFDVLEALGVCIELPIQRCAEILAEVGVAVFFAPTAHPAMRFVAPVRKEIGIRTLMNCIGPLLNPVGAKRQLVGVYSRQLVATLAEALAELGCERALVVHGSDGLDELTTTGPSWAALLAGGVIRNLEVDAAELGLSRASPKELAGGDAEENAGILRAILAGEKSPRRDIVLLNAAAALWVAGAVEGLEQGLSVARRSIDLGAAAERLEALVRASNRAS